MFNNQLDYSSSSFNEYEDTNNNSFSDKEIRDILYIHENNISKLNSI